MYYKQEQKLEIAEQRATMQLDIVRRARSGESYEQIGETYGVSRQNIGKLINRLSKNQEQSKMSLEAEDTI